MRLSAIGIDGKGTRGLPSGQLERVGRFFIDDRKLDSTLKCNALNSCRPHSLLRRTLTTQDTTFSPHPIADSDTYEFQMIGSVTAGFPSAVEDIRERLFLVKLLVRHSVSTFLLLGGQNLHSGSELPK